MKNEQKTSIFANLQYDLPAGIVVFLVALPLCLGIALASGAPLFSGIIAGIVGGLVVSLFSGSPMGVSGPAAGLVAIVLVALEDLGSFEAFLLAVLLAGVIQIIFGFLKAGIIGYYFPTSVIQGMLSGIGVIIILKQIPHAFGYDGNPEGDFAFFQIDGQNTLSELGFMLDFFSPGAIVIALVSLGILILWEQAFMKQIKIFRLIQGPLLAVLAGIGLNFAFAQSNLWALGSDQVVNLPVATSMGAFFDQFTMPDFSQWNNPQVYITAVILAVVASIETLLCLEATDKLDPQKRVSPANRELFAQGIGNMVSGLIGGLPITQVIVRSSANIQAGGRTRMSDFFHGTLLLVTGLSIPFLLNLIPLASLAAILIVVGYKLAKPAMFVEMYYRGKGQFVVFAVTVAGIIFTDLLVGIGMGLGVAVFRVLWDNYKIPFHFDPKNLNHDQPLVLHLSENVSFLNKAGLLHAFNDIPADMHVIIDGSKTRKIHPDAMDVIEAFIQNAPTRNITVALAGFKTILHPDPVIHLRDLLSKMPFGISKTNTPALK